MVNSLILINGKQRSARRGSARISRNPPLLFHLTADVFHRGNGCAVSPQISQAPFSTEQLRMCRVGGRLAPVSAAAPERTSWR
jgi:hypothetical protein